VTPLSPGPQDDAVFHLFQDQRIAARCRLHLGRVGCLAADILDFALLDVPPLRTCWMKRALPSIVCHWRASRVFFVA
jgi:hypothetical protein